MKHDVADAGLAAAAMTALTSIQAASHDRIVSGRVLTRMAQLPTKLRMSGVLAALAHHAAEAAKGGELAVAYAQVGAALREQTCTALGWDTTGLEPIDLCFLDRLMTEFQSRPASVGLVSARLEQWSIWLRRLAEALEGEQKRRADAAKEADDAG